MLDLLPGQAGDLWLLQTQDIQSEAITCSAAHPLQLENLFTGDTGDGTHGLCACQTSPLPQAMVRPLVGQCFYLPSSSLALHSTGERLPLELALARHTSLFSGKHLLLVSEPGVVFLIFKKGPCLEVIEFKLLNLSLSFNSSCSSVQIILSIGIWVE